MAPNLDAYNLKVDKLRAELGNATDGKKKLLGAFSKDYLLLPDLWRIRIELDMGSFGFYPKKISKLIKRAFFDFYSDTLFSSLIENEDEEDEGKAEFFTDIFQKMEEPFSRTLNSNDLERVVKYCAHLNIEAARKLLIGYISFPHSQLDDILLYVQMFLCEPMSQKLKQTFRSSKALYEKIVAANDDIEKWFKLVLSTKDDRFIIQNVECRIAREPDNFQVWKMYIEYLGSQKYKAMLQVVYRYQRLFIDDNSFDFKINSTFEKFASLQYLQSTKYFKLKTFEKSVKEATIIPCNYYYNFPTSHQVFPFPSPMIRYITKEAQADVLQSLYQSCKYFFDKRRQPLCYYLSLSCPPDMDVKYYKNRMYVRNEDSAELQNICLTGALSGISPKIISKISESRLRYIRIFLENLSIAEYDFLTKSGEIEHICMLSITITVDGRESSEPITLENLLKNLPKAKYVYFHVDTANTPDTAQTLLTLERINKFNFFHILVNRFPFDAKLFVKFIEKNANPLATLTLTFKGITQEERSIFDKEVEAELLLTNNQDQFKPTIFRMVN